MSPVRCEDVALILPRAVDAGEPVDLSVQQHVSSCLACQDVSDRAAAQFSGYNRRGSKDSQLR